MHYWLQESLLCAEHIFLQQCAGLSAFPSQPIFRCTADNALLAIGKTAHFTRTTNKPPILLCEPVLKGHVGTKSALTHTKKKKSTWSLEQVCRTKRAVGCTSGVCYTCAVIYLLFSKHLAVHSLITVNYMN